jgi:hypothetical protein
MRLKLSFVVGILVLAAGASRAALPVLSLEESFEAARSAVAPLRAAVKTDGDAEDRLLDLLGDNNPAVRAQAALSLRPYAADDKVTDGLMTHMQNAYEDPAVRKAAIKSLSDLAAQSEKVRDAIIEQAQNQYNADVVREIACKALYTTLFPNSASDKTRDALTELLGDQNTRPAVRAAAAWGLFPDAQENEHTQDALLDAAKDQYADGNTRMEALRSLYFAMDRRSAVPDGARAVAEDNYAPAQARAAAVLIHMRVLASGSSVLDWLQELARNQSAPAQVRTAAVQAQGGLTQDLARFFHFVRVDGLYLDPIAGE